MLCLRGQTECSQCMPSFTVKLWTHARIRVHNGKTHVWNMSGVKPVGCDMLQRLTEQHDPEARAWTGSEVPAAEQGIIIILGTPLGHEEFVRRQLELKFREHDLLLLANSQFGRFTICVGPPVALCLFPCRLFVEGDPA